MPSCPCIRQPALLALKPPNPTPFFRRWPGPNAAISNAATDTLAAAGNEPQEALLSGLTEQQAEVVRQSLAWQAERERGAESNGSSEPAQKVPRSASMDDVRGMGPPPYDPYHDAPHFRGYPPYPPPGLGGYMPPPYERLHDPHDMRDPRDLRDPRDRRDGREPHDPHDSRDPRDAHDSRDPYGYQRQMPDAMQLQEARHHAMQAAEWEREQAYRHGAGGPPPGPREDFFGGGPGHNPSRPPAHKFDDLISDKSEAGGDSRKDRSAGEDEKKPPPRPSASAMPGYNDPNMGEHNFRLQRQLLKLNQLDSRAPGDPGPDPPPWGGGPGYGCPQDPYGPPPWGGAPGYGYPHDPYGPPPGFAGHPQGGVVMGDGRLSRSDRSMQDSGAGCDVGMQGGAGESVDENGIMTRDEFVNVYILAPPFSEPRINDVTILTPKPQLQDRILAAYHQQKISYSFSESVRYDRKKVQSRRDAEVVRVKKFLLRSYLANSAPYSGMGGRGDKRKAIGYNSKKRLREQVGQNPYRSCCI